MEADTGRIYTEKQIGSEDPVPGRSSHSNDESDECAKKGDFRSTTHKSAVLERVSASLLEAENATIPQWMESLRE